MRPLFHPTPLLHSHPLSRLTGRDIYLKCEALQPSGSFKDRGIGALCAHYAAQSERGFICASAGNAGLAVAYAAQALHRVATIVVPCNTPKAMIEKLQQEHAEVILFGDVWDDTNQHTRHLEQERALHYIHPFDHPIIWQGYTTLIDELHTAKCQPDAIIVSVGGGGLYSGLAQGCEKIGWHDVTLITAETVGAASFAQSYQQKKRIILPHINTIARSLGAKQVCQQAFDWSQRHPTVPQTMTDQQAINACISFANDHRLLVEPACGAALAIAYDNFPLLQQYNTIVIIVCGGSHVSLDMLHSFQSNASF